jgi:pimeloyl-ACP methyl ester carboxylesterase
MPDFHSEIWLDTLPWPGHRLAAARPLNEVPSVKDVILIHGAWAGGWVWDALLPGLRAAGYRPHALDLPGNGADDTPPEAVSLDAYRDHVLACLEHLDGPAWLVAHSGGGLTATAVAEALPGRVAGIAFVAGMMLPSGLGFTELCEEVAREGHDTCGIGPYLETTASGTRVPAEAARWIFLQDVAEAQALAAARRLVSQPHGGRSTAVHWSAERAGRVPRLYVEARGDRSVVLPVQRAMQRRVPGARIASLDCGHVPQLAAPDALLDALISFFAETDALLAYPTAIPSNHQEPRP